MRSLRFERAAVVCCLAIAFLSGGPGIAAGQSEGAQNTLQRYERLVDRGIQEMKLQNYLEARSLFLDAHKASPSARTLRALGMVEFELRNYVSALAYLDAALQSSVKPLDREKKAQVEQLRDEAKSFVARYSLTIVPPGATVELDGVPVKAPYDHILLQVGEHTLRVSADGYHVVQRTLSVAGGDSQEVAITLLPAAERVAKADASSAHGSTLPRSDEPVSSSRPARKQWWLWTTIGVVIAGAAAGTAIALMRDRTERDPPYGGSTMSVLQGPR
jgi:hypothetical protein